MLHTGVIREIRVANCRVDLQSAIRHWFNLVERQAIDVEHVCGCLDIQLHEIDQRCSATHEPHLRALLRRLRLCGSSDGSCRISWPDEFEAMHRDFLLLCALTPFSNLLDRRDDIGVGAATASVAAHPFLSTSIVHTPPLLM